MGKRDVPAVGAGETVEQETARIKRAVAAKRKALRELEELNAQEAELLGTAATAADDSPEEGLPGTRKIESILENLSGDGSFDIVKLGAGGVEENLGSYDVSAWPEGFNLTLKEHGSGNYLLRFRNKEGKQAGRVMRTYRLAGSPIAAPVAGGSNDMMAFMKMMQESNDRHERAVGEMRLEMARQQAENSKALIELVKSQNSGGLFKNAQDLAVVAKLFKDDNKGSEIERMLDLKELLEDFKGSAREEVTTDANPLFALLAPLVSALIPKPGARRAPPAGAPVAPASLGAPLVIPAAPPDPAVSAAPASGSLAQFVPSFKAAIEAGVKPEEAADFAWKQSLDKGQSDSLVQLLESADWRTLDSDVYLHEHRGWVTSFRIRLESLAFEPSGPDMGMTEPAAESDAVH